MAPTVRITVPKAAAARIDELNARWIDAGMPERCTLPRAGKDWRALLKSLPGYDPFRTDQPGLSWDVHRAVQVIGFFHEYIRHIKGEWGGTPVWLEPWQQAWLANLLGWLREDGTRRYRRFLLYIARKNAKTTMAAGLALHLLCNDGEAGAELYCAASDREQAALLFSVSQAMVKADADLGAVCRNMQYSIVHAKSNSAMKVLSALPDGKHGFNAHLVLVDELHAQATRELYDVLATSTASRRQPLIGSLTTADHERPSLCNEMHTHARDVMAGRVDDWEFLPAVWEAGRRDDITDPKTWAKANPNLGISVKTEYLRAEAARAEREATYRNTFKKLHLNIRTEQAQAWMDMSKWDACGPADDATRAALRAEQVGEGATGPVGIGVDLANTEDWAAMAAAWPIVDELGRERVRLRTWYWIPSEGVQRREDQGHPVRAWQRLTNLTVTDGTHTDYATMQRDVAEVCNEAGVLSPHFDPFNAMHLTQELQKLGLDPVLFHQGNKNMNTPTRHLDTLVSTGELVHEGCPVLAWMVGNTVLHSDTFDQVRPSKRHSAEKIDGTVAAVIAIGAMLGDKDEGPSVYEDRGLLVI